ncbi:hypothetical protein GGS23DRAFT_586453 [Durotheca rogersii]|uniref:uncharacterized protein n=1 Tax=Durotheca rogersii TaxID=419775 RepID=UPI00221EB5C2|nr:uncharacterized protein GGS23DRAFT_586453 [Durotheca rogersii]KAI5859291.1 hypothetical protein GGS23DRAFT_586453 [Durotheca rogersii]
MDPLKVLIIGGGVAGPTLAYWLSRIGANITLIERSPNMRATGQQVDLRAHGVPMMQKMGIEAAVRAASVPEAGTQLVDVRGRVKAFFPAERSGTGMQSFTSEYEIMRGDLVRILYGLTETRRNVRHLFGATVDAFTQDDERDPDGKVHVRFADGRSEDYDLVVGADGAASKTRKMMLGPGAPDPRFRRGSYIGYFSVPAAPGDSDRGTFCHLPGRDVSRVVGTRKDRADLTRVYMIMRGKYPPLDAAYQSGALAELKKAWGDLYQDGGWECRRFTEALRHAPEADDLYCTPFEEVRLPQGGWSRGRVVLLGDSAYCQTAGGFGCTWSLVGAYVLAGEIATLRARAGVSRSEAVIQGAKNYEERFRPLATAGHGGAQIFDYLFLPRSPLGIGLLHACASAAAYFRLDRKASMETRVASLKLPDYPELEGE